MYDPFITPKEADQFLYMSEDWLNQEKKMKEYHILTATGYMLNKWSCDEFDVAPDYIKRSCAFYALENMNGNLYSKEPKGNVIEITDKLGTMQNTTKWNSSTSANPVQYIDDIMLIYCTDKSRNAKITTRT
jgi:hypothetical protein